MQFTDRGNVCWSTKLLRKELLDNMAAQLDIHIMHLKWVSHVKQLKASHTQSIHIADVRSKQIKEGTPQAVPSQ